MHKGFQNVIFLFQSISLISGSFGIYLFFAKSNLFTTTSRSIGIIFSIVIVLQTLLFFTIISTRKLDSLLKLRDTCKAINNQCVSLKDNYYRLMNSCDGGQLIEEAELWRCLKDVCTTFANELSVTLKNITKSSIKISIKYLDFQPGLENTDAISFKDPVASMHYFEKITLKTLCHSQNGELLEVGEDIPIQQHSLYQVALLSIAKNHYFVSSDIETVKHDWEKMFKSPFLHPNINFVKDEKGVMIVPIKGPVGFQRDAQETVSVKLIGLLKMSSNSSNIFRPKLEENIYKEYLTAVSGLLFFMFEKVNYLLNNRVLLDGIKLEDGTF